MKRKSSISIWSFHFSLLWFFLWFVLFILLAVMRNEFWVECAFSHTHTLSPLAPFLSISSLSPLPLILPSYKFGRSLLQFTSLSRTKRAVFAKVVDRGFTFWLINSCPNGGAYLALHGCIQRFGGWADFGRNFRYCHQITVALFPL